MIYSQQHNSSGNASATTTTRGIVLLVVESCMFFVLDVAAFFGNMLVCLALYRNPSLRTVTNKFILSLAITDLLMAILVMPLTTTASIANKWVTGQFGCRLHGFGSNIFGGTSLLTMMLLAINRYFRVVRPMLYDKIFSKKTSVTMIASAWVSTTVMVIIGFFVEGIRFQTYAINPTRCFPRYPSMDAFIYFNAVHSVYIAIPSFVIIICYVKIYQTIRLHNNAVMPFSCGVEEANTTRLLTVVLVGFLLCWLPVFITVALENLKIIGEAGIKYNNFFYGFPVFASSVINPIIYATLSRQFRMEFLKILC